MNIKGKYFVKNSTLLEEIQKSKLSYCCYDKKNYDGHYDIICDGYSMLNPLQIEGFFNKNPEKNDIIIRVMTAEHILPYYKNDKINLQELKLSPFKQFVLTKEDFISVRDKTVKNINNLENYFDKINELKEQIKNNNKEIHFNKLNKTDDSHLKENNSECKNEIQNCINDIKKYSESFSKEIKEKMVEILRSHWKGETIEKGTFSISHGQVTNDLIYMLMTMIDRYSKIGNWSGYTYLEDMKSGALLQLYTSALKFEEHKSNNAFSYFTQIMAMKFTAIINSEKIQRGIKSKLLQDAGYSPTFGEMIDMEYNYNMEFIKELG